MTTVAASIYLEKDGVLRLSKGFPLINQDIGDINFFVYAKGRVNRQVFLILKDEQGLHEVVELKQIGVASDGRPYKVYRISLKQKLRLTTQRVSLSLFLLEIGTSNYEVSENTLTLSLTTDRFNLHREIYLSQELGSKVQCYYEKIVTLLEQLTTIDEKGDN